MPRQKLFTPESALQDFFRENPLPSPRLLVAVSGGPDSVCLLHLLAGLRAKLRLDIFAAHLNHRLRGRASAADAQYVFDLCHKLEVPVTIGQADVKAYRKEHKLTLEEAAREVRYQFLADTAWRVGARVVAVAHTRDDNVETILLHILRGTGTRGLMGLQPVMPRVIDGKKITIVRPLLAIPRAETAAYCRRHRLQPRYDATNASLAPLRNRVRLELLPLLRKYNAGIDAALLRAADIAAADTVFLEKTVLQQWRQVATQTPGQIIFDREKLTALPVSITRGLLRMAVEKLAGTLKDVESRHLEAMLALTQKATGKSIELPYGLDFTREYDRLILALRQATVALDGEYRINVPGVTLIPGWQVTAGIVRPGQVKNNDPLTAYLDADKTGQVLVVRGRRPGDRFQPLGMGEAKKVSDFMLDARVPRARRTRVPIVASGTQVFWVVGYRIDEQAKVTQETQHILQLVFRQP